MYFSEIKKTDIANGTGVRVTLFVSGCRRHCKNCFNSETWSFTNGKPFTDETQRELLDALDHSYINGLTLLGGEPMEIENQRALLPFLRRVRAVCPNKDVWCYTGFTLEEIQADGRMASMLPYLDVLVDGPFIQALRDPELHFRGSSNQRIIYLREQPDESVAGTVPLVPYK